MSLGLLALPGAAAAAPAQEPPPKKAAKAAKVAPGKPQPRPAANRRPAPPRRAQPARPRPPPSEPFPAHSALHCAQDEPGGYRERGEIAMTGRRVDALEWTVTVGRHGQCRFALDDFAQKAGQEQIELDARDASGCRLLIWRRGPRVTLAHQACERRCGEDLAERIWPISFDARTGRCAG